MTHWMQQHRRHIISVALILFIGYILADIVVGVVFPITGNSQGSLNTVFAEMKFLSYWVKKLVFSIGGGVLYAALLWYLKPRTLRES